MLSLISLIVNDAYQEEIDCQKLEKYVGLDTVYDKLNICNCINFFLATRLASIGLLPIFKEMNKL